MISFNKVSKAYGSKVLLDDASFTITKGDRIALVGRNGAGKSTILRMLTNNEEADSGEIIFPKNYKVGFLKQRFEFTHDKVIDEVASALSEENKFSTYLAEKILFGLGFNEEKLQGSPDKLSGGYRLRMNLAMALVAEPDLLILDEPTNFLDIISIKWLETFLRSWKNELVIVSHSRDFLDNICNYVVGIHRQKLRKNEGNVHKFYSLIAGEEEQYERERLNVEKKMKQTEEFIDRFRAKATKATLVQSRIKALNKMVVKERLTTASDLDFNFNEQEFTGKVLLEVSNLSFGYTADKKLINNFSLSVYPGEIVCIIGANGMGKSTLMKLLTGELTPTSGAIKFHMNARYGVYSDNGLVGLNPTNTIAQEIATALEVPENTAIRNICGQMMFSGDDALKPLNVLSGGEVCRVRLGKLIAQKSNLLFFDEPTNHLDIESTAALLEAIKEFNGASVIISHDEQFLNELAQKLIVFQPKGIEIYDWTYDEFIKKRGFDPVVEQPKDNASGSASSVSDGVSGASNGGASDNGTRLSKQERAKLVEEKSAKLKGINKRIVELENSIEKLEIDNTKLTGELEIASSKGDYNDITAITSTLEKNNASIDEMMNELGELYPQQEEINAYYDALLKR